MNPESLNTFDAGGRELWGSQPAPLLVLACCWGFRNHKNRKNNTKTKNHLHESLYKTIRTHGSSCRRRASSSLRRVSSFSSLSSPSRAASHSSRVPVLWLFIV